MLKRGTIGKVQLIIGILLLIVGIVGVILTYGIYSDNIEDYLRDTGKLDNDLKASIDGFESYSEESKTIIKQGSFNVLFHGAFAMILIAMNFGALFILSIILSLLFITQGLVNISEEKQIW